MQVKFVWPILWREIVLMRRRRLCLWRNSL